MFLRERATVAILYLLRDVLRRKKAKYLKRWREFNMYFEKNRILKAVQVINRVARGKLGRIEAAERRVQRAIQIQAEMQRQAELATLRNFSATQIERESIGLIFVYTGVLLLGHTIRS